MLVVLAPPDIVNSPLVIVDDALERKPLPKVARSDWENAPATESVPKVADVEYRLVEEAVVLKRLVVVARVSAAEFAERTPKVAEEENKFVLLAVVLKRVVVVALVAEKVPVERLVAETEVPEKELAVMEAFAIATLSRRSILPAWAMTW